MSEMFIGAGSVICRKPGVEINGPFVEPSTLFDNCPAINVLVVDTYVESEPQML
jgi:hypothetical protein